MLARLRLTLPDQPGTLGRVASAIGACGADVHEIQVLASELGRATDDVWVRVAGPDHLQRLVRGLTSIRGVDVEAVRSNVTEVSRLGELELVTSLLASDDLQVVLDQAVAGLDLTWAALVDQALVDHALVDHVLTDDGAAAHLDPVVLVSSAAGPAVSSTVPLPLRLAARESPDDGSLLVVPLPPTSGALILARRQGPSFHTNEVFRLAELGRVLGGIMQRLAQPGPSLQLNRS